MEPAPNQPSSWVVWAADLSLIAVVVVMLRLLGFEGVFQDDVNALLPSDPQYHLRRAFHTFVHFPDVLFFDPYINYPDGAPVPWPPLFDFVAGGIAHFVASDQNGFERVMAWTGPVLGALTGIPIYAAGRLLANRYLALAAGLVFAFLPFPIHLGSLANPDHHAAVSLIGACLLYLCMAVVDPSLSRFRLVRFATALGVARAAMVLCWSGSLLYLVLVEGALLLAAAIDRNRRLACSHALSALGTALGLVPFLIVFPAPLGGYFSSIAFSWLHVLAMLAASAAAAWLSFLLSQSSLRAFSRVVGGTLVGVAGLGIVLLLVPGPLDGLLRGVRFLAMDDGVGTTITELRSLFPVFGRAAVARPELSWGWAAYLIPICPLGPILFGFRAASSSRARRAAWMLAAWATFFGMLTVVQVRYGGDFAPAAALAFVVLLAVPIDWGLARSPGLARPRLVAGILGVLIWTALQRPVLENVLVPKAERSISTLRGDPRPARAASVGVPATLLRFMDQVRHATPETSSYFGGERRPEYGILASPDIGHAIQYRARRPTSANPFFGYVGRVNWDRAMAFQRSRTEFEARATAEMLSARYVITMPNEGRRRVVARLHLADGNAVGNQKRFEHFRLVTESVGRGRSILSRHRPDPPLSRAYKLFEIVEGARVEVAAKPGATVDAVLELETPAKRKFVYRAQARGGSDGIARLRLPYATDRKTPVRAAGPYALTFAGARLALDVSEGDVVSGETLRLRVDASDVHR